MLLEPFHTDTFHRVAEITERGPHRFHAFYIWCSWMQQSSRVQSWPVKLGTQTTGLNDTTDHTEFFCWKILSNQWLNQDYNLSWNAQAHFVSCMGITESFWFSSESLKAFGTYCFQWPHILTSVHAEMFLEITSKNVLAQRPFNTHK